VPSQPGATVEDRYIQGGLWIAVLVMSGWHVLSILPVALSGWLEHGLAIGALLWLGLAVVGAVSAWVVVRGGGHSVAFPLAVCVILLSASMIGSLTSPGGMFGHYNWPFAVVGWFGLVALWRQPLRALLGLLAVNALTGVTALVALGEANRLDFARLIVQTFGVSALEVTIYVGSRAVAATARIGAEAADAATRTRIVDMAAEANRSARRNRYEAIQGTAVPLLERLASGRLNLADGGIRQEIAVTVMRLRRDLVESDDVSDLLSHELRACADAAGRRGIAVDLIAPAGTIPVLPIEIRHALTEPVIHGLASAATRARVTVVASATDITVAIVTDTRHPVLPPESRGGVEVSYDQDEKALWIQARWTGALSSAQPDPVSSSPSSSPAVSP
jgi:hypothetical protein